MTPDEAIQAHREWKTRFLVAMARQEQMNVAKIASDNCCEFGTWLHAAAKSKYGHLRSYEHCVEVHAAFHVEAGKVAEQVNQGHISEANQMLGYGTPYTKVSETLAVSVVAMFQAGEHGKSWASRSG